MKLRTEVILLAVLMQGCTPDSDEPAPAMAAEAASAAPALEAVTTLQDVQSGKVAIRALADAKTTALWHARSIRSLERTMFPGRQLLTDDQLQAIVRNGTHDPVVTSMLSSLRLPQEFSGPLLALMNGRPLAALAPAGMLFYESDGKFQSVCSGILSRNDTVITARHCLEDVEVDAAWKVFVPFEGIRDVETITPFDCPEEDAECDINDLATMSLEHPYEFAPFVKEGTAASASVGAIATILGFGITTEKTLDHGILREGRVGLQACFVCDSTSAVIAGSRRLCFTFTTSPVANPQPTPGLQGNLLWDSGGPMLAGTSLSSFIGVASENDSCDLSGQLEGRYVNVTSPIYDSWLESTTCTLPCLTSNSSEIFDPQIIVSGKYIDGPPLAGEPDFDSHTFTVGNWSRKLIVAMNHETLGYSSAAPPAPKADLKIVMPGGLGFTECEKHWGVEVCTVVDPAPGNYELKVQELKGDPFYQLTVSVIRCPTAECPLE